MPVKGAERMKLWTPMLLLVACKSPAPADATSPDGSVAGSDGAAATGGSGGVAPPSLVETYARAGAVVGSCMPDDGINRNVARFWDPLPPPIFWSQLGRQASCLATAGGGCQALKTCLGYELTTGGPACTTNSCAGSMLTACGKDSGRTLRMTFDCAKVGQSCDPQAYCSDGPPVPCASTDPSARECTADGRGSICKNGTLLRTAPCADLGLTCQSGDCRGTGADCPASISGSEGQVYLQGFGCEGSRLRACVGGKEQPVDCAAQGQGFGCQSKDGHSFCGLAAECLPSERDQGTTTCEGSTVVFCNAGRLQRVDCMALGFTGCDVDTSKGHFGCVPGLVPRQIP
jgi:hypothetical protein